MINKWESRAYKFLKKPDQKYDFCALTQKRKD